jgi:uncharacterized protein YoxC
MSTSDIVQLALAGLVVLNLIALGAVLYAVVGRLTRLSTQVEMTLKALQEETTVTLQQAHDTLARVETLSKSVDGLVNQQIAPTMALVRATAEQAELTARAVRGGAEGACKLIGAVQGVAAPASAAALAGKLMASPSGRISAGLVTALALARTLLSSKARATKTDGASVPKEQKGT